jgi:hypothetical protein
MPGRKPGTRKSMAKGRKRLNLNKETLKDLAPAEGEAVRGGGGPKPPKRSDVCITTVCPPHRPFRGRS